MLPYKQLDCAISLRKNLDVKDGLSQGTAGGRGTHQAFAAVFRIGLGLDDSNSFLRRCFARRILDFAVPSGICSWRATSAAVISNAPASTTGRTRIGERRVRADRISARLSSIPISSSSSQDPGVGLARISNGSVGIARFFRTQSRAAFRTIVVIHAFSEPRAGSNVTPFLHARSKAACATSSAEPASPTIRNAIQHSRRRKSCTNCLAHSSSPAQKPSRSSSDTLSCGITSSPLGIAVVPLLQHEGAMWLVAEGDWFAALSTGFHSTKSAFPPSSLASNSLLRGDDVDLGGQLPCAARVMSRFSTQVLRRSA